MRHPYRDSAIRNLHSYPYLEQHFEFKVFRADLFNETYITLPTEFHVDRFLHINQNYKEYSDVEIVNKHTGDVVNRWYINRKYKGET